jgi:hypothetical protein
LKLENLKSSHHFRHDATGNSEFAAVTTLTINCGEPLQDIGKAFVPGDPALFIDQFKHMTKLSFSGGGHQVQGCEMALMLNEVRLPKLVALSLGNSSFYRMGMLYFCYNHQDTLKEIELTRMTLRAYHVGDMISDIVEVDKDWAAKGFDSRSSNSFVYSQFVKHAIL